MTSAKLVKPLRWVSPSLKRSSTYHECIVQDDISSLIIAHKPTMAVFLSKGSGTLGQYTARQHVGVEGRFGLLFGQAR